MKKFTLVSVSIGGVCKSVFIELEYKDNYPVLPTEVLNSIILQEFGYIPDRGITYTVG